MGIKGLDSFEAVLEICKNPDAFAQKLNEIKTATQKYQEVVEAVVELSKVNDYTVSITKREEQSKQALAEAQAKASKLIEDAKLEASDIKLQARKQKEKQDDRERTLGIREKSVAEAQDEVQRTGVEIARLRVELEAKSANLDKLIQEVTERKTKLLEALK